ITPRIIGGSSALPGSHPWLAAIYIGDQFCAGSLIHPCWVATAAHCFAASPLESTIRVVLGQHTFNRTSATTQSFEVDSYMVYPKYSPFSLIEHDIALVKLKRIYHHCVNRSRFIQTICLPDKDLSFPEGHPCQIAGWGHLNEGKSTSSSQIL
uniref:Peptidase S1 domain-containing protein n=1 Tax=Latimeria chalumnae TaxID=7897 RepID=H2ZS92_LATCH